MSLPMRGSLKKQARKPRGKTDDEEPTEEVLQAANWLLTADALVIASGAGLSAYGGLPTFTGPYAWDTFANQPLEEVLCAQCFQEDPSLAWGLWCSLLRIYGEPHPTVTKPYLQVKNYANRAPLGAYVITTTVDGIWLEKIGWVPSAIYETHGKKGLLMCTKGCRELWEASPTLGTDLKIPHWDEELPEASC
eukprot:symbB.v1.2.033293.t1/scaffold4115.1/size44403/2